MHGWDQGIWFLVLGLVLVEEVLARSFQHLRNSKVRDLR